MKKKILGAVVLVILVAGAIIGVKALQIVNLIQTGESFEMPATTVAVAVVETRVWTQSFDSVGTVESVQGVTLANEIPGKVIKIDFESGTEVQEGDLLVELDVSSELAQLASTQAAADLASVTLERNRELRKTNALSQSELDAAEAQFKEATARVDDIEATIAKKRIRAPFSGLVGIRQINAGQFLGTGDPIISLNKVDPVYVNFALPQQLLAQLKTGLRVQLSGDTIGETALVGELTAIDGEVEVATRNVRLQATFANPERLLRPGMFVNVAVVDSREAEVSVIPVTAVVYAAFGDSVFVVNTQKNENTGEDQLVVQQKFIRLGVVKGDFVAVVEGLKPGDRVVSEGAFKLSNGAVIDIGEKPSPEFSETPEPVNS